MRQDVPQGAAPILFLLSAVGVMVPIALFWGNHPLPVPFVGATVSTSVFLTFVPVALAVVFSTARRHGVTHLFARLLPTARIPLRWYVLSSVLNPALQAVAYLVAIALLGREYAHTTPLSTLALIVPTLVLAAAEEVGWTGYATAPLQQRWGPLGTAVTLGAVAVIIHLVPYVQAGHGAAWILGQCAVTVGGRVVMIWVFNKTGGSILPAVLLHATYNTAYILYPYQGSHYDPIILAAALWTFCAIAPLRWAWTNRTRRAPILP